MTQPVSITNTTASIITIGTRASVGVLTLDNIVSTSSREIKVSL